MGCKTPSDYMLSELAQVADIVTSVFHYSASPLLLRITAFGSEQFHGELWPNNAMRLSRIDWLWSAKRASVWVTGGGRRRVNQENPPMRIYIIGNDGITLCHEAPATVNEGEIAVASNDELQAPHSAAGGCWPCGTLCPVSRNAGRLATARR